MSSAELVWTFSDGVVRLTLNRPDKRNAVTAGMWADMVDTLSALAADNSVRVLAVQGAGGAFCAGADLASVRDESGRESSDYRQLAEAGLSAVRQFPRPTVAVIDGPCIGAGLILALACDLRFASPRSSFALPAVRYGLTVADVAVARLVELTGSGTASRILLSSAPMNADRAAAARLVEHVGTDYADEAQAYVDAVSRAHPDVVTATRSAIFRSARLIPAPVDEPVQ